MDKKKWILYGTTGVFGLSLFAGGAVVAANALELRTTDGTVVPGGAITDDGRTVAVNGPAQETAVDSSVTVVSVPSAASVPTPASAASAPSAQTPVSVPTPASPASPASAPSAQSAPTPASPPSAASPASAASAGSL
ncbi:hypothetical protein J4H92_07375 [Leucobacter weissii]|uniref:Uncharacterized protein n=1 Tax=Leucobacter weissii TaxID=1983706 RepID=A0A939MKT6_9MICO|nr:hypothetical protein [Leucobacter weissii]MBO1901770.1 hypothetical protein [Leucobacter weissii]